jgi:hypothetical protein
VSLYRSPYINKSSLHPRWLPWADIVLTYIVEPYGIWIVKLRCIRHANILKRTYLCKVSDTEILKHFFPIRSYVKTMSAEGGHLGWRSGSPDTILKIDHLRTIHAMFAFLVGNHQANWIVTLQEWSLGGPVLKLWVRISLMTRCTR